jgi:hypothetical protein
MLVRSSMQACSATGGQRSPYNAWGQPCYTQALHKLLQRPKLLASLPPDTLMNMAVTFWIKPGSLDGVDRSWCG